MLKHNKNFNHTKGIKHGQCHVRSNTDFNNHNTARDKILSLKNKAPSSNRTGANPN